MKVYCICNAFAARDRIGCLNTIFKMCPDKNFVQGEKNTYGRDREGSLEIKRYPKDFIGRACNIIFSIEPGVQDTSQVFKCWKLLGLSGCCVGYGAGGCK